MIRKFSILLLVICLAVFLAPGLVQGQDDAPKITGSVQANFPASITFNINAESSANIIDIRLRYSLNTVKFVESYAEIFVPIVPAAKVTTKWVWDMRETGGLPPGSSLVYWWQVTDSRGQTAESLPAQFVFEDTSHTWQKLTDDKITILWYRGDNSFAQSLMTAAKNGLVKLANDTGAEPVRPFKFYIYGSNQDYQKSSVFPTEWSGGYTASGWDVILLGIEPGNLDWGERSIVHEMTHLVVGQITNNPYNGLPVWLNEGLAMKNEGLLDPGLAGYLNTAVKSKSLISVQSLSDPFPAIPAQAYLSYAESYDIVDYLIVKYGQPKMLDLLNTFARGATFNGALEQVYGLNLESLNSAWQENVYARFAGTAARG